ncbi:MAG: hypothetical protein JO092_09760 [Candidatus Eremiobacteraeota bacterium]|nr:hypothetical protein [Candidatus Eremiobacteraeota bacterium]
MRMLLYAAALAVAAIASCDTAAGVAATAAGVLFESTPFLLGGIVFRVALRAEGWMPYLGCGCGTGSSARSLPATAAAWFVFGPAIALSRLAGAIVVNALLRTRFLTRKPESRVANEGSQREADSLLGALEGLLPAALLTGIVTQELARFDIPHAGPFVNVLCGLLLGVAAPCGLGAIAVASALHAHAPTAATAYLSVAGIVDVTALRAQRVCSRRPHDACSYAMLILSLGLVAFRHGDALVHPKIAFALWLCATAVFPLAVRYRRERAFFFSPVIMLLGALAAAPAPSYRETETTLADLFPGERLSFTGRLAQDAHHAALVRYAITCCRADAVPVSVRLAAPIPIPADAWIRADGVVVECGDERCLLTQSFARIAPPSDPFVYR